MEVNAYFDLTAARVDRAVARRCMRARRGTAPRARTAAACSSSPQRPAGASPHCSCAQPQEKHVGRYTIRGYGSSATRKRESEETRRGRQGRATGREEKGLLRKGGSDKGTAATKKRARHRQRSGVQRGAKGGSQSASGGRQSAANRSTNGVAGAVLFRSSQKLCNGSANRGGKRREGGKAMRALKTGGQAALSSSPNNNMQLQPRPPLIAAACRRARGLPAPSTAATGLARRKNQKDVEVVCVSNEGAYVRTQMTAAAASKKRVFLTCACVRVFSGGQLQGVITRWLWWWWFVGCFASLLG